MNKNHWGYTESITQGDVNEALKKYNVKQRWLAKVVTKRSKKEGGKVGKRSESKRAIKKITVLSTDPMASESRSEAQVSNSEGCFII